MKPSSPEKLDPTPTPERRRHGRVELVEKQIADADGAPAQPYQAIDALRCLHARGRISTDQLNAAERFRADFRLAHLDAMRAADLARVRVSGGAHREMMPGAMTLRAQRRVMGIIAQLGGASASTGSCAWHVIGCEMSVRAWAREIYGGSNSEATGVLVAVATLLDAIYSGRRAAA